MKQASQDYFWQEEECNRIFEQNAPFFFVSAEHLEKTVFHDKESFKNGINATAIALAKNNLNCYSDVIMNNHGHWLLGGRHHNLNAGLGTGSGAGPGAGDLLEACHSFFSDWKKYLYRCSVSAGYPDEFIKNWQCHIIEVDNLKSLRNIIIYIARNPYVTKCGHIPTGYPWGSVGYLFDKKFPFNDSEGMPFGIPVSSLPYDENRKLCRSRHTILPKSYRVYDNMILPVSYLDKRVAESLFRSPSQYFSMLYKHGSSDLEIASIIGETVMLPDEEVYMYAVNLSRNEFSSLISELDSNKKTIVAKKLKYEYGASKRQIAQVLKLSQDAVNLLFST